MRVKENKKLELKSPQFLVDHSLNKDIEKYDVLSFLNRSSANAFVGTSGSGKTSLMYSFLMNIKPKIWKKQFENIIVVMPKASRNSLKNNIFDKYVDESNLYDDLTEQTIDQITEQITENASEGYNTLLIMDDVASALKNPYIAKKLQHLVYAYRHYKTVILLLVQTLKTIPLSIRKNLSNLVVFHKPRLSEWDSITEEFLEMDKKESQKLYDLIFDKKYGWGLINLNSGRIFKEFDEVLYKNLDDK